MGYTEGDSIKDPDKDVSTVSRVGCHRKRTVRVLLRVFLSSGARHGGREDVCFAPAERLRLSS